MTLTAADRAAISRQNGQKSHGPKSPEGKARSRFNALKHGLKAKTLVLPGEDAEEYRGRLEAWMADFQPQNDVEQTLLERAVTLTWQLDRAARAEAARLSHLIRKEPDEAAGRQQEEVLALGQRLFFDRGGPLPLYPHGLYSVAGLHRVSDPQRRDDPDAPPRLLLHLEATASGCRWLLDRWAELGRLLERGQTWQSPDKLKAIRLLGHQPLDAADSDVVATIFLACAVLGAEIAPQAAGPPLAEDGEAAGIEAAWQQCGGAFTELMGELTGEEAAAYRRRLEGRQVDRLRPKDPAAARAALQAIVDKATIRLEAKREVHEARAALEAAEAVDRLAFDASPEGEQLRRFQLAGQRALLRTVDALLKLRRQETMGPAGGEPAEPAGTGWAGGGCSTVPTAEGGCPPVSILAAEDGCSTENPPIEPTIEGTAPSSAPADSPAALSEPRISSHDSRPSPLALGPSPAARDTHGISPNEPGHEPRARCDSPLPRAAAAIGQALDGQPHSTAPAAPPPAGNRVGAGAKAQPTSPHSELGPRAK
jgi:hypothetical protein